MSKINKKFQFPIYLILFLVFSIFVFTSVQAGSLSTRLKGKILLQVEKNGEAWYINPDNEKRYYMGRPQDAFNLMRGLGLGISESDFNSFNSVAPTRLSGKILLQVEKNGEAWYINPVDLKMHYLGRPADAFQIMRSLGLGITDNDLDEIEVSEESGENQEQAIKEDSKRKTCQNNNLGLKLEYPKNWGECGDDYEQFLKIAANNNYDIEKFSDIKHSCLDNNCYFFKTDYEKYDVYLIANIKKIKETELLLFSPFIYDIEETESGKIFRTGGGGSYDFNCYINQDDLYHFTWHIDSNQPIPSNIYGIWTPKHNVSLDIIYDILRTAEPL